MTPNKNNALLNTELTQNDGLCGNMTFSAAESYKMLRTKIHLIIPMETASDKTGEVHHCRIIGITSAMAGEGKTTTSINLAYTIAETGQKVCLLEADMRLPNIARRLGMRERPGLSNILTGQFTVQQCLQKYVGKNDSKLYLVPGGDVPPTPSELLESGQMKNLLQVLAKIFDTIIVDLPPVSVVTDALTIASSLTGMLLVVRKDYCDKHVLADTMAQFRQTDTKLLGVVFNDAEPSSATSSRYSHKYKNNYKYNKDMDTNL